MTTFKGTVIEESLANKKVLDRLKITHTNIEPVVASHDTPELSKWTLHNIELESNQIDEVAKQLSRAIKPKWYAHFYNSDCFVVIFPEKVFSFARKDAKARQEVEEYGISWGIPAHQMDFAEVE